MGCPFGQTDQRATDSESDATDNSYRADDDCRKSVTCSLAQLLQRVSGRYSRRPIVRACCWFRGATRHSRVRRDRYVAVRMAHELDTRAGLNRYRAGKIHRYARHGDAVRAIGHGNCSRRR